MNNVIRKPRTSFLVIPVFLIFTSVKSMEFYEFIAATHAAWQHSSNTSMADYSGMHTLTQACAEVLDAENDAMDSDETEFQKLLSDSDFEMASSSDVISSDPDFEPLDDIEPTSPKRFATRTFSETGDRLGNFPCVVCHKKFISFGKMADHALHHYRRKIFKCPSCSLKFITPSLRNGHHKDVHHASITKHPNHKERTIAEQELIFEVLNIAPADNSTEIHLKSKYRSVPHFYICNVYPKICKKKFVCEFKLKDHLLRHLNAREFVCPICHILYNCPHDRNAHVRSCHNTTIAQYPETMCKDKLIIRRLIKPTMYTIQ